MQGNALVEQDTSCEEKRKKKPRALKCLSERAHNKRTSRYDLPALWISPAVVLTGGSISQRGKDEPNLAIRLTLTGAESPGRHGGRSAAAGQQRKATAFMGELFFGQKRFSASSS